jgi:hypothetical protein
VPTALSSTEATRPAVTTGLVPSARRAVTDVGVLFRFRAAAVRRRHLARVLTISVTVFTLLVAVVPAFVPGAHEPLGSRAFDILILLPTAMAGVLMLNMASAVASGGGRELITRDQASPYPISPTTDHLGALVLAPLNIAWMIQAWLLLGSTAFAVGPAKLVPAEAVMILWLVFSTTLGQVIAWSVEAVRRGPFGIAITRTILVSLALTAGGVQVTHHSGAVLDAVPTVWLFVSANSGWSLRWLIAVSFLLVGSVVAVGLGAVPAHLAAHRMPRDEARMETDLHQPRPLPRSVLGILVRTDRASVWRSVPMRRGLLVLGVGPGLVAIFGNLSWESMTILPGLVASGGALLFGVNAWCLDGRGALWRENLPAAPTVLFDARTLVLTEFLAAASMLTVAMAALRAGIPNAQQLSALACTLVVVLFQVVGASMRWSIAHPYPVDLRSARATPAPPAAMVGYSSRLAVSTTFTSLMFSGTAHVPDWKLSVIVAIPCVMWSGNRLLRARRRWQDPVARSRVVTTAAS